jgi:hypothetical protein
MVHRCWRATQSRCSFEAKDLRGYEAKDLRGYEAKDLRGCEAKDLCARPRMYPNVAGTSGPGCGELRSHVAASKPRIYEAAKPRIYVHGPGRWRGGGRGCESDTVPAASRLGWVPERTKRLSGIELLRSKRVRLQFFGP